MHCRWPFNAFSKINQTFNLTKLIVELITFREITNKMVELK